MTQPFAQAIPLPARPLANAMQFLRHYVEMVVSMMLGKCELL
jgi:hypothetical protein